MLESPFSAHRLFRMYEAERLRHIRLHHLIDVLVLVISPLRMTAIIFSSASNSSPLTFQPLL